MVMPVSQRVPTRAALTLLASDAVKLSFPLGEGVLHEFHSFSPDSCQLARHAIRSMGQRGYSALCRIPQRFWGERLNGYHMAEVIDAFRERDVDIDAVPDALVTALTASLSERVTFLRELFRFERIAVSRIDIGQFADIDPAVGEAIERMQRDASRMFAKPPLVDEFLESVVASHVSAAEISAQVVIGVSPS